MKTNCWLILGAMIATSAVAQVNTNPVPVNTTPLVVPLPDQVSPSTVASTNAPAKKTVKHKKHAKKAKTVTAKTEASPVVNSSEAVVTLTAGDAMVAFDHVNVRGQAGVKGEVIDHLQSGDKVTVISQINLDKHKAGEPFQWAKIALPSNAKVWVDAKFVDATNKVVAVKKLNMRGGPGENYSVLGVLEQGTPINEITNKGDWWQIDAPTNAYAFVAAIYLKQTAPGEMVAATVPTPPTTDNTTPAAPATPVPATPLVDTNVGPVTTNTVAETPTVVAPPAAPLVDTNIPAPAATDTNAATPAATTPESTNTVASDIDTNDVPPPPRIVTHEGVVHNVRSIIAPTYYELDDLVTGHEINYLYTTSTNLDLSKYKGLHIIVTGQEGLAERWKDTPVLTIQRIQVVE